MPCTSPTTGVVAAGANGASHFGNSMRVLAFSFSTMAPTQRAHAILPPDPLNTTDLSRFALLVTTFNSLEREPLYTPRLRWWLNNSALDPLVVDSAGQRGERRRLGRSRLG